ncbi:MAG: DPP IV N-terminal domain-containing protein [Saprospiraceae bacterium]
MIRTALSFLFLLFFTAFCFGQGLVWSPAADAYYQYEKGQIFKYEMPEQTSSLFVSKAQLTPQGKSDGLEVRSFSFSVDGTQLLIYTNSKRVWRYDTRGDYWVLNLKTNALTQLGKAQPESSLMFAKFSPDGEKVAYVSERNLYVETLANGKVSQLTSSDSGSKLINGTFDWVYEEEFDCRDGFRWCPDSKRIAYWQIDANKTGFFMINTTDSIYPFIVPVEYPKVGMTPSPYKIGVVDIGNKKTKWMNLPGDPQQTYLPRMEWTTNGLSLLCSTIESEANATTIFLCDAKTGEVSPIYQESDEAWIDLNGREMVDYFKWVDSGRSFCLPVKKTAGGTFTNSAPMERRRTADKGSLRCRRCCRD